MSNYLFCLGEEDTEEGFEGTMVMIVEEGFWKANGHLDDQHITEDLGDLLPDGFDEIEESVFYAELTGAEAREALIAKGMREEPALNEIGRF